MSTFSKRQGNLIVLVVNFVIIASIFILFVSYMNVYHNKLHEQNIQAIRNTNRAAAQISSELSARQEMKLSNVLSYITANELSVNEIMKFVNDFNADSSVTFHLISSDYSAYVLKSNEDGTFPVISYSNNDYKKIQEIVDNAETNSKTIPFTVEFSDPYTGSRSYGRYVYVAADDSGVNQLFTLLAVFKSADFADHINLDGGFERTSSVLINEDGSYALRNSDFKSENFYKYIYAYNNLTLDELKELKNWTKKGEDTVLYYKDSLGEDTVFVYSAVSGTNWFCITAVPLDSFHNVNVDVLLAIILVALLVFLAVIDCLYLFSLNRKLKTSAVAANAANEAKTDFLSRMSHDIRTPINVINGMTELALLEKNPANTEEYLYNIHSSGTFLLGLVNDILDMNKVESGKMELHPKPYLYSDFDKYMNAVIRPLCDEKNICFTDSINTTEYTLVLDSLRFNQIIFNLLSNAVKFTSEGGRVNIDSVIQPLSDTEASLNITVSDNGSGMSEEFQRVVFEKFSQEERNLINNKASTGLGLSIVKRLIELMNGTITLESSIGVGTKFFIHLECEYTKNNSVEVQPPVPLGNLVGKRILLCEDHPLNTKIIVRMLSFKSVNVETAENGQVGLEMFSASPEGYYDAILMDIRMPIMDGLEATKAIRALSDRKDAKDVPIIALTANAYDTDIDNCIKAGMNAHLAKPIELDFLCETLSKFVNK